MVPADAKPGLRRGNAIPWDALGWACVVAPLVGLAWAWIANQVQAGFAPWLLFPVLLGVFSGLTLVGLVRFTQFGNRRAILIAVLLAAAVAALGQHYLAYLSRYDSVMPSAGGIDANEDFSRLAREFKPAFHEYLAAHARHGRPLFNGYVAKGWFAWLTWAIDAALVLLAAVAVTLPALRVPYCRRCGTWYRTIRNGKVDVATGRRLAEICGIEEIGSLRSPRYRLSLCQGGCSPLRCELSWEEADRSLRLARLWLDAEQRRRLVAALDALAGDNDFLTP